MKDLLEVRVRNLELDPEFQAYLQEHVEHKLSKFAHNIEHVRVSFEDVNGPRGTPGHQCVINVQVRRHDNVVVQEVDDHYRVAFDKALGVVAQNIDRTFKKDKEKARRG